MIKFHVFGVRREGLRRFASVQDCGIHVVALGTESNRWCVPMDHPDNTGGVTKPALTNLQ